MDLRGLLKRAYETLVISKCPVCGEIVRNSGELCENCFKAYKEERDKPCPYCRMSASVCVCNTRRLRYCDLLGHSMFSFLFYEKENPLTAKIIYALKRSSDRASEKFLAKELSKQLSVLFEKSGERAEEWIVTYPPRTRKAFVRYGFDQSKNLARRIAADTGMTFENVFSRRGKDVQKTLDFEHRILNARSSFTLKKGVSVKGKKYIIIDDVVTSGATANRCQSILLKGRAKAAFPVTVAKTPSRGAGHDIIKERKKKEKRVDGVPF